MITRIFKLGIDDDFGTYGLRPANRPEFNHSSGITVMHDLLEHFPDDTGDVEGELMALGAMLYVRDGDNWFAHTNSRFGAARSTAAEMVPLSTALDVDGRTHLRPCRQPPIRDKHGTIEGLLDAIYFETNCLLSQEFSSEPDMIEWTRDGADMLGWMRLGYRRAKRRYRRYSERHMEELFRCGAEQVDRFIATMRRAVGDDAIIDVRISADLARSNVVCTPAGGYAWLAAEV